MIQVEGVTKRYGPKIAVNNISFEVDRGEIVGFLGPNGAGKTTTMRILTGFLPPTSGTARVGGFDVLENPIEVKRRIGYLPESPPLYPEMEVGDYLRFVAGIKGIRKKDIGRRIDRALERTSSLDVRDTLVSKLSKGYRQRVGLAQALIHNPEVLVFDEPTSGLDPKQIIEARGLIRSLAGDHTIILSTHILSEVQSIASRIIIISDGKLEASDTPENLMARMRGHESVLVEIDGPPEDVEERLLAVEGVNSVSRKNGHGGRTSWAVETSKDAAIRSELARAVVESGWGLYEIRPIGMSLEDIFLKLTASEDAAESAGQGEPASEADAASPQETLEPTVAESAARPEEAPPEVEESSKQEGAGAS
jgi:ABC-2 type transport system ATP-binding protein